MTWLEILYITKNGFSNNADYNSAVQTADKLSGLNDETRRDILKDWLVDNHLYSRMAIEKMNAAFVADIDIDWIYDDISKYDLKKENIGLYAVLLPNIVQSGGRYLSKDGWDGETEAMENSDAEKFIDEFNSLKSGSHSLDALIRFCYGNSLNRITEENVTGKKDNDDTAIEKMGYSILTVADNLNDVKKHENALIVTLYQTVIRQYDSDEDFISEVAELVNDYIELESGVKFNGTELIDKIKEIKKNYPSDENVAYDLFVDGLTDKKVLGSYAKEIENRFKKAKFSDYSLETAIKEFIWYNQGKKTRVVTDDTASDEFSDGINECLGHLFSSFVKTIDKIKSGIDALDRLFAPDNKIYINKELKFPFVDAINLWKDFINSEKEYKMLGKKIDDAVAEHVKKELDLESYKVKFSGKEYPVLNTKNGDRMMEILDAIVVDRPGDRFDSIMPWLNTKFAKADLPVSMKIGVQIRFVQYIYDFFTKIEFKKNVEIDWSESVGRLFDAVCNLVYYKVSGIKENVSLEGMFFGSYSITESESFLNYFRELWKSIFKETKKDENSIDSKDVVKYVHDMGKQMVPRDAADAKSAEMKINNTEAESAVDASVIGLVNAGQELNKAVDSRNGVKN